MIIVFFLINSLHLFEYDFLIVFLIGDCKLALGVSVIGLVSSLSNWISG